VRAIFRNSRIIGRRFRLVHVIFSRGKVIETATFRRSPTDDEKSGDDLLIRFDNAFGSTHEDALRRDFTINALFYDLEHHEVLDWCGGMDDIERRTVRTIGDPVVRFQEDPVRILRAIKFSARLDLGLTPELYHAIVQCRGSLAMAARPRLFEELLRLLRGGASHRSIWLAWETGVLDVLLPELAAYLADQEGDKVWRLLRQADRVTRQQGEPLDDVVLFTTLLLDPMLEACAHERDRVLAATDLLEPIVERLNVPRRISDSARRILAILPRLEGTRAGRFRRTALYPLALQVYELVQASQATVPPPPPRPRRRSRRRRRSSPEAADGVDSPDSE
jgi:poly(A) polymerase